MEIKNMNLEQVNARLSALIEEVRNSSDLEFIKNATTEKNELLSRKEELETLEQRKKEILEINAGSGTVTAVTGEPQKRYAVDSPEYRTAWLMNLQGKEISAEARAAITATAAIPTMTANMIVARLDEHPLLGAIDVLHIPGYVTLPAEDEVADAQWTPTSTDSTANLTPVTLGAYKIIKTVEVGADVSAMAVDAFETWLVGALVDKLEGAAVSAVVSGDGASKATGILHTGVVTNTGTITADGMTYADLMKIIGSVPTKYARHGSFVMNRTLYFNEVLGMTTDAGERVVVVDPQAPAKYNILGYPVILEDAVPAGTVIFGDLKGCYKFNWAKEPTVTADTSVGFRSGSTVWRVMGLADGKVAQPKGFAVYTKA
ncbi:MAG: phage major capsid protein [Clostridia bacterium]|nr:phage major capsid protein [Clostridia bacterium]